MILLGDMSRISSRYPEKHRHFNEKPHPATGQNALAGMENVL